MQDTCNLIKEKNTINKDCCNKSENEAKKTKHYTQLSKQYYTRLEDKRKNEFKSKHLSNTGCCHPHDITVIKKRNSSSRSMMNMKVVLNCCN